MCRVCDFCRSRERMKMISSSSSSEGRVHHDINPAVKLRGAEALGTRVAGVGAP